MASTPVGRAGFVVRRRALRLSETARAALVRAPVVDDEGRATRTSAAGPDPLRVLLFGSGALVGYGVRSRADAVDGPLAELLAGRTGRGVTVESRVRLGLLLRDAVPSLGGAGTVTFHVAVWCPSFGDELRHRGGRRTRRAVGALLQQFREGSAIPLVVCELPTPLGSDWRSVLRRPRVHAFNAALRREAGRADGVHVASTGTYRPLESASELGPAWHRGLAQLMMPVVARALGLPA